MILMAFTRTGAVIPAVLPSVCCVVARQFLFITADIMAKVIFGVLIAKVAFHPSWVEIRR